MLALVCKFCLWLPIQMLIMDYFRVFIALQNTLCRQKKLVDRDKFRLSKSAVMNLVLYPFSSGYRCLGCFIFPTIEHENNFCSKCLQYDREKSELVSAAFVSILTNSVFPLAFQVIGGAGSLVWRNVVEKSSSQGQFKLIGLTQVQVRML